MTTAPKRHSGTSAGATIIMTNRLVMVIVTGRVHIELLGTACGCSDGISLMTENRGCTFFFLFSSLSVLITPSTCFCLFHLHSIVLRCLNDNILKVLVEWFLQKSSQTHWATLRRRALFSCVSCGKTEILQSSSILLLFSGRATKKRKGKKVEQLEVLFIFT